MCYNLLYTYIMYALFALFKFFMRIEGVGVRFMEKQYCCAITGHRPSRFRFKYSEDHTLCKKIKNAMREVFCKLYVENGVRRFYVGGALGVDMWAAEQILRMKEQSEYKDIELIVVLPFECHASKWDERSKHRMDFILRHSSGKVVVADEDCKESYRKRNCYMVDHTDYLVAVYDYERNMRSGTMQCVRYAQKRKRQIVFIHPDTARIVSASPII